MKQTKAIKLEIYSTYSPRSTIHFLVCCSNYASNSKKFRILSVQPGFRGNNNPLFGRKMASFQLFSLSREQVVVRRGQIRRIGWVIKIMETQVGQLLLGCKCPLRGALLCKNKNPLAISRGVYPSKCSSIAPAEMSNTARWYFGSLLDNQRGGSQKNRGEKFSKVFLNSEYLGRGDPLCRHFIYCCFVFRS